MDKDETFEALGELYRDGFVDMKPTIGDVPPEKQQFSINEDGMDYAEGLMKENPKMVEMLIAIFINEHGTEGESVDEYFQWIRDEVGVNPVKALQETDPEWFNTDDLDEEFIQVYEPA